MSARRFASIALAATAASAGCATARNGHLARPEVLAQAPQAAPDITAVVAKHNRNAAQVESLRATPSVSVSAVSARMAQIGGGASGTMVFERPHNFRFVVKRGFGRPVADIGSNDDEFWFWGDDKSDPNIYVCRYDSEPDPNSAKELNFQPDWIVEALGLREVPKEEIAQIKVTNGPRPNTVTWTHNRTTPRGEVVKKVSIVDRTSGEILEHRFYVPGSAIPIATAKPLGTENVPLPGDPGRTVRVPQKIHLTLTPADTRAQTVEMDLVLNGLKVNSTITEENRTAMFTVPKIQGSQVLSLGKPADPAARAAGRDRPRADVRQSAPSPEAGSGVKLGDPTPIDADENYLRKTDPMPLGPDLGGIDAEKDQVVGVPIPRAPENPAARTARRDVPPFQ